MVGSSVLPACFHKGKLYFLFGKENSLADTPGWSDFGGGVEKGESIYSTAMREGGEELTGFLGNMEELIKKNGGVYKMQYDSSSDSSSKSSYHVHLFHLDYSDELVNLYNNNHKFLWKRMNQRYLTNTKLFEKIEIKWFSMEEMKKRKHEFRSFYKNVIDIIIEEEANIKRFLQRERRVPLKSSKVKGKGKSKRKSRRIQHSLLA
jgi:hypothetical protein